MSLEDLVRLKQEIAVTVWPPGSTESNDRGETFISHVKALEEDRLLIHPPPPGQLGLLKSLTPGTVVGMVIKGYRGDVLLYPRISGHQSQGLKGYWLQIPREFSEDPTAARPQRRRHVRIPMKLPLILGIGGGESEPLSANTCNISGGGLRFTADKKFARGDTLKITFRLDEDTEPLTMASQVVFCNKNPAPQASPGEYMTAAFFTRITRQEESAIMNACFRWETRLKKSLDE